MKSAAPHASSGLAREAHKLLRPLHRNISSLLQELIRTNTVAIPPNGNETPGQLVLRDFLKQYKVDTELYEIKFPSGTHLSWRREDRNYSRRKNLIARISGSGRGKSLLLNGHMDTVPPGKTPWSFSPWSAKRHMGNVYGLGSFDMKGGLVAQAGVLCALRMAGIRPGGDILAESVIDEEWGGGGGTLAARLRGDTADACVISEGTQLDIFRATRGGMVVDLQVAAGDPKLYFSEKEVLSPAISLGRLLAWIDGWSKRRRKIPRGKAYAEFADPAPVQVLAVQANTFDPEIPLSVPSHAAVRVYLQFLPHEDVAGVIEQIQRSLEEFSVGDPFFRSYPILWKPLFDPPLLGHELAAGHPWTRCMVDSASASLRRPAAVKAAPYPSDAFLIHREFGIPTLLFGPCGGGAHNPDEYVEVQSVIQTAEVLLTAALQWCMEH